MCVCGLYLQYQLINKSQNLGMCSKIIFNLICVEDCLSASGACGCEYWIIISFVSHGNGS